MQYFDGFDDQDSVFWHFQVTSSEQKGVNILVAMYDTHDYCGSADVLFRKNGILYEVYGSHCSCNGLEGQWEPEEASEMELRHRASKRPYDPFLKAVIAILDESQS